MKMKEACNEVDVKFVDNDANFTFRNVADDDAAFQRDGLHLSESGVGRLLLNLSLPEQTPKHNKRQHQQQHRHVSNVMNHDRLPHARVATHNVSIVCVSKTWFKDYMGSSSLTMQRFCLERKDRGHGRAGGVACYIRNDYAKENASQILMYTGSMFILYSKDGVFENT